MPRTPRPKTNPPAPKPLGRPPERVVLTFYFKMGFSTDPIIQFVPWPKNWPVPQQGDAISVGEFHGIVSNLHFKPDENILIVNLR